MCSLRICQIIAFLSIDTDLDASGPRAVANGRPGRPRRTSLFGRSFVTACLHKRPSQASESYGKQALPAGPGPFLACSRRHTRPGRGFLRGDKIARVDLAGLPVGLWFAIFISAGDFHWHANKRCAGTQCGQVQLRKRTCGPAPNSHFCQKKAEMGHRRRVRTVNGGISNVDIAQRRGKAANSSPKAAGARANGCSLLSTSP